MTFIFVPQETAECGAFSKPCFENCQNVLPASSRNESGILHSFDNYSPQDKQKGKSLSIFITANGVRKHKSASLFKKSKEKEELIRLSAEFFTLSHEH